MGVYDYNETSKFYEQRTNESISDYKRYVTKSSNSGIWYVESAPGFTSQWLKNYKKSDIVPSKGWKYWDDDIEEWKDDDTITIQAGNIVVPCYDITMAVVGDAAEKWPNCCNGIFRHTVRSWVDGVFTETNSWVNGRPAYVNEDGHLLYMASDGTWSVGKKYGNAYVWADNSHSFNPSQSSDWLYYTGGNKSAQIQINCT